MTKRVVIGTRGNGDCGLFMSPPGVDAVTANDADLYFSSKYGSAGLVHVSGLAAFSSSSGVPHTGIINFPSLSYVPMVLAGLYSPSTGEFIQRETEVGNVYTTTYPWVIIRANSFEAYGPTILGSPLTHIRYWILKIPSGF